jgi:hypothetical protein
METKYTLPSIGDTFGDLTVVEVYKKIKDGKSLGNRIRLRCKCGNILSDIRLAHLYGSASKNAIVGCTSCRNKNRGILKRAYDNRQAKNAVFFNYKTKANQRNFSWNISKETFFNVADLPCIYCGEKKTSYFNPPKTSPWSSAYFYTGIDRINSDIGYEEWNIQPCCKWCNISKSNRSEKDFIDWIKRTYNNLGGFRNA